MFTASNDCTDECDSWSSIVSDDLLTTWHIIDFNTRSWTTACKSFPLWQPFDARRDSYGKYDIIEYAFIWVITIVMTVYGMPAALIAGVTAAQSIAHRNPIRGVP